MTNWPSKRGSRDWITPYRSSNDMVGVLMCSSLPRLAASDWRKSDTAVVAACGAPPTRGPAALRSPVTIAKPPLGTGIGRDAAQIVACAPRTPTSRTRRPWSPARRDRRGSSATSGCSSARAQSSRHPGQHQARGEGPHQQRVQLQRAAHDIHADAVSSGNDRLLQRVRQEHAVGRRDPLRRSRFLEQCRGGGGRRSSCEVLPSSVADQTTGSTQRRWSAVPMSKVACCPALRRQGAARPAGLARPRLRRADGTVGFGGRLGLDDARDRPARRSW